MVADRVEVFTHSCEPEAASLRWSSDGREGYSIETLAEPLDRGTRIVIRLKDEYEEFSQEYRVKELLRRYSNFVGSPSTSTENTSTPSRPSGPSPNPT